MTEIVAETAPTEESMLDYAINMIEQLKVTIANQADAIICMQVVIHDLGEEIKELKSKNEFLEENVNSIDEGMEKIRFVVLGCDCSSCEEKVEVKEDKAEEKKEEKEEKKVEEVKEEKKVEEVKEEKKEETEDEIEEYNKTVKVTFKNRETEKVETHCVYTCDCDYCLRQMDLIETTGNKHRWLWFDDDHRLHNIYNCKCEICVEALHAVKNVVEIDESDECYVFVKNDKKKPFHNVVSCKCKVCGQHRDYVKSDKHHFIYRFKDGHLHNAITCKGVNGCHCAETYAEYKRMCAEKYGKVY
jgi:hypothetical protein